MNDLINKNLHLKFNWNSYSDKVFNFDIGELIDDNTTLVKQELISFWRPKNTYNSVLYENSHFSLPNENGLNEARIELQEDFARQLIQCIKEQHFEYGVTSMADNLVAEQMEINTLATKHTINRLFTDNYNKPDILIGLLQIISRIPIEQISPEGYTIATATIPNENIEVKETAIRCFENWGGNKSLTILQGISVNIDWLKDYINSIINDIREELCLT